METISILTKEDLQNLLETSKTTVTTCIKDYDFHLGSHPSNLDYVLGSIDQVLAHLADYSALRNLKGGDLIHIDFVF